MPSCWRYEKKAESKLKLILNLRNAIDKAQRILLHLLGNFVEQADLRMKQLLIYFVFSQSLCNVGLPIGLINEERLF